MTVVLPLTFKEGRGQQALRKIWHKTKLPQKGVAVIGRQEKHSNKNGMKERQYISKICISQNKKLILSKSLRLVASAIKTVLFPVSDWKLSC